MKQSTGKVETQSWLKKNKKEKENNVTMNCILDKVTFHCQ